MPPTCEALQPRTWGGCYQRFFGGVSAREEQERARRLAILRAKMLAAMAKPAPPTTFPDVDGKPDAVKIEAYAKYLKGHGAPPALEAYEAGDRVMIGFRKHTASTANKGQGLYDDRMVVLWTDAKAVKQLAEFNRFNTDPTAQYDAHYKADKAVKWRRGESNTDADEDGTFDLGRMAQGSYEMIKATHGKDKHFAMRPSPATFAKGYVQRDTNADGLFDAKDGDGARHAMKDQSFKIHRGSKTNTDSAGCQTFHPLDYAEWAKMIRGDPKQTLWWYVLIDTKG